MLSAVLITNRRKLPAPWGLSIIQQIVDRQSRQHGVIMRGQKHNSSIGMDAHSPMSLILVGQNELYDRLNLQAYAAIRQRIDIQCKLPYYDRVEVGEYIRRHLDYAGTQP